MPRRAGRPPGRPATDRLELAVCLSNRGRNQTDGKLPGAEESSGRSLDLFDTLAAGPAPTPDLRLRLAAARSNLGDWRGPRPPARRRSRTTPGRSPSSTPSPPSSPACRGLQGGPGPGPGHFGELRIAQGRPAEARTLLERGIREGRARSPPTPGPRPRRVLRKQLRPWPALLIGQGAYAEAAKAGEESLKVAGDLPAARVEVARLVARCIPMAAADARPHPEPDGRSWPATFADRAIALLREAIEAGDPGSDGLLGDDAFDPIRDRDGFKTLRLASAEGASRPGESAEPGQADRRRCPRAKAKAAGRPTAIRIALDGSGTSRMGSGVKPLPKFFGLGGIVDVVRVKYGNDTFNRAGTLFGS